MVFIGVMLFGFVYNTIVVYILMIIISFVVRLLTALFMRAYIQMHPTVSKQLTIAAMFLPATIYMVIGVLGIGGGGRVCLCIYYDHRPSTGSLECENSSLSKIKANKK